MVTNLTQGLERGKDYHLSMGDVRDFGLRGGQLVYVRTEELTHIGGTWETFYNRAADRNPRDLLRVRIRQGIFQVVGKELVIGDVDEEDVRDFSIWDERYLQGSRKPIVKSWIEEVLKIIEERRART